VEKVNGQNGGRKVNLTIKLIEYFDDHFYKIELEDGKVEYLPSVTTKLGAAPKPFLARWRGDIGNREADQRMYDAANKGKRIHYAVNLFLNDGVIILNPFNHPNYSDEKIREIQSRIDREVFILQDQDEMLHVSRFQEWLNRTNAKVIGTDMIVYDLTFKEAGTLDFAFEIEAGSYEVNGAKPLKLEKGIYIADLKTGSDVYDEAFMQIAAYTNMYFNCGENWPTNYKGSLIIHTGSKTRTGIPGLSTVHRNPAQVLDDYVNGFRHVAAIWDRQNENAMPRMLEFPALITKNEEFLKGEK
jgi:hypothetical protein